MSGTVKASGVQPIDLNCLSADCVTNGFGAVAEYEVVTRKECSAPVASGTFTVKTGTANEDLGEFLNTIHATQACIYTSPNRLDGLNKVKHRKNKDLHLGPKPRTTQDGTRLMMRPSAPIRLWVMFAMLIVLFLAEVEMIVYTDTGKTINRKYCMTHTAYLKV